MKATLKGRSIATLAVVTTLALATAAPAVAVDRDQRIVGGAPTTVQEYPWQAAMALNDEVFTGDGFARQFCGGTVVAPTIVISAAHCFFDLLPPAGNGFEDADNFEVFTGRTVLSSTEGQAIDLAEIYYFQGTPAAPTLQAQSTDPDPAAGQLYNPDTSEWDAVFVRLEAPSTTGTPILLAGPDEAATWAAGQPALISGWGALSEGGSSPDQLHAAQIGMLADTTCADPSVYDGGFIATTMVCAGVFPAGGIDTCQGDSGGPLVVPVFDRSRSSRAVNAFRLVGDTSFGLGCARPNFPGVYGRVAADPLRSAMQSGIQQVAGVDVVGSGAVPPDGTPPETRITKHPKKKGTKKKAKFKFAANEAATFQCKVDKKAFRPCTSPFKKKVVRKKHKFRVFAVDEQGNVEGTPAKFRWKVSRPKQGKGGK